MKVVELADGCNFMSFSTVFQSVIPGLWVGDNERLGEMEPYLQLKMPLPQTGIKLGTARPAGQH